MITDEQWPVARLIPISSASGIEAQERRAASALLAVMSAVNEFGRVLLKPLGAPAGKVQTFIEVPFKVNGGSIRPDGIIAVSRAGKTWGAVVETKTGAAPIDPDQINNYLDLARQLDFQAVLTISNQYVSSSTEYPVEVDKRRLRKVSLHHWSWVDVLTEAILQKQYRGVSDPDQAYILQELIRYLSDPRSGAVSFDSMGPGWTAVREKTRSQTLRRTDPEASAVASRWDDLMRYLALELTKDLGRDVKQVLGKAERTPTARRQALQESLATSGRLYGDLQVPDAAGLLRVTADLLSRQVIASTRIDAPRDGRSKGRISWLLRQLPNASESLTVEARIPYASASLAGSLGDVRKSPELIYPEGGREVRDFSLTLARSMGVKRDSGRGSFVESVITTTKEFYSEVLQNLRPWKAAPPKLSRPPEETQEPKETPVPLPEPVEEAVEEAGSEVARGPGTSRRSVEDGGPEASDLSDEPG